MTTVTPEDAIRAASSIARDVAEGRLTPATLEAQLETELRTVFGVVVGPEDPAWPVQLDVARGVLAVGGVPTDELAEWLAVARHRAGEPVSEPVPDIDPPTPVSLPTVAISPEPVAPEAVTETEAVALAEVVEPAPPVAKVAPPRRSEGGGTYDPLAAWRPGETRRR